MLRLLSALLLLFPLLATAHTLPAAAQAYLETLRQVESAKPPVSLEPLLAAAREAETALMTIEDGDRAWIETLSDADFTALQQQLRGLRLSRGVDVYAMPDDAFLLQLAQARGRPEDQAFFKIYDRLWGPELVPSYLQLGSRPTPCVRFGEDVLPGLYEDWRGYARQYPTAYREYTQQTVADLEEAVALGVCTCSDDQAVVRELSSFIQRFPDTPVKGKVKDRLQELKTHPDRRPVYCR